MSVVVELGQLFRAPSAADEADQTPAAVVQRRAPRTSTNLGTLQAGVVAGIVAVASPPAEQRTAGVSP